MFLRLFSHFVLTIKTTQPRPQVFSVNGSIVCNLGCTIDVIGSVRQNYFQIWSTLAFYDELFVFF